MCHLLSKVQHVNSYQCNNEKLSTAGLALSLMMLALRPHSTELILAKVSAVALNFLLDSNFVIF